MTSMNDAPPNSEEDYINNRGQVIIKLDHSSAPANRKTWWDIKNPL